MQVSELTPELLSQALDVYLTRAYPHGNVPPTAQIDFDQLHSTEDVLDLFTCESRPGPDGSPLNLYALRLGNERYPHMKVSLVQFLEPGVWVWTVDTHDRMPVAPGTDDWDRFQELRILNLKVKASVEAGWRAVGLDTCRVVARRMPTVEAKQTGPLILVVDDEDGMRQAAVNILRGAGYRVIEASSGLEGIERFVEQSPQLVLSDYEMPGMDGLELSHRLREFEPLGKRTPILMATAGNWDLSSDPILDGFLVKPYQRSLLLSFVELQLPPASAPEPSPD
jgi:CheY-like chemotaxis protein